MKRHVESSVFLHVQPFSKNKGMDVKRESAGFRLTVGPFLYEMIAHDSWGESSLNMLDKSVICVDFSNNPDRVFHLLTCHLTPDEHKRIESDYLPDRLVSVLPVSAPRQGWKLDRDETGRMLWWHADTHHTLWTFRNMSGDYDAPFQLPWRIVLEDIVKVGGGVFHGGLVVWENRGYLFSAPSGGGKTTLLSRMPDSWKVMADDAILVWPGGNGTFLACPMPTWSVILNRTRALPAIGRWQLGSAFEIVEIFFLEKADHERLVRIPPIRSVQLFYRALCEHPRVLFYRHPIRKPLFHTACTLARVLLSWKLELTKSGNFSHLLPGSPAENQLVKKKPLF